MSADAKRIAVCWSGGKDSARAYLWSVAAGYDVVCLVSALQAESDAVAFHGTPRALLEAQAHAIGVPLVAREFTAETAGEAWLDLLGRARELGASAGIFGDDYRSPSRDAFYREVFDTAGVELLYPLEGLPSEESVAQLIADGVRALIVAADKARTGAGVLGRELDADTVAMLAARPDVDVGGAYGEFHTLVLDAPFFHERLEVRDPAVVDAGKYLRLDIRAWEAVAK